MMPTAQELIDEIEKIHYDEEEEEEQ